MLRRRLSSASYSQVAALPTGQHRVKSSNKAFRPKRVIGRIVPFILGAYVYQAYKLVVIELGYVSGVRSKLGARIPESPFDPPLALVDGPLLFQCASDGSPIRCQRDYCNGKWKPPRSRHCGDCRTCVPALDHHCPWFDSNISSPTTMLPFVVFLGFALLLYAWSFAALLPIACKQAHAIWLFGRKSSKVHELWWQHKSTWMGGPFFRWIAGWIIAGSLFSEPPSKPSRSLVISSPNLRLPVTVFIGLMLIFVASGLLVATLLQIKNGDLSVDVERRKAFSRLLADHSKISAVSAAGPGVDSRDKDLSTLEDDHVKRRLQKLSSVLYFRVNMQHESVVVSTSEADRPYDLGWRENFRVFLGLRISDPHTSSATETQFYWPLNIRLEERLRKEAEEIRQRRKRPQASKLCPAGEAVSTGG